MSVEDVRRAVAWALTGTDVPLPPTARWTAQGMVDDLGHVGWDREAIASHAAEADVWPHPVSADLLDAVGPAQMQAALREVRSALGLTGQSTPTVAARRDLTAAERRLLDDKPPHH